MNILTPALTKISNTHVLEIMQTDFNVFNVFEFTYLAWSLVAEVGAGITGVIPNELIELVFFARPYF